MEKMVAVRRDVCFELANLPVNQIPVQSKLKSPQDRFPAGVFIPSDSDLLLEGGGQMLSDSDSFPLQVVGVYQNTLIMVTEALTEQGQAAFIDCVGFNS